MVTDDAARQADSARRAVLAVWGIEAAKIVAVLTRFSALTSAVADAGRPLQRRLVAY